VGVGLFALAGTPVRILALALAARLGFNSAPQLLATHALIVSLISVGAWSVVRVLSDGSSGGSLRSIAPGGATRAFLRFAGPYLGTAVLTQVCTTSERWGLARLESPAATALFVLSLSLATAGASAAASPLMTYFQPIIVEAVSKRDGPSALRALRRLSLTTGAVMLVGALAGMILGPFAATLLFGARYLGVAAVLPWTVLGACAFALGQALANYPFAGGDSKAANGALALSQVCYATILLTYHPAESPAVGFGRVYAGAQLGYLALMSVVAWIWRRRLVAASEPASVAGSA
jgi:O-antigen/teichoic acid export membrane protein